MDKKKKKTLKDLENEIVKIKEDINEIKKSNWKKDILKDILFPIVVGIVSFLIIKGISEQEPQLNLDIVFSDGFLVINNTRYSRLSGATNIGIIWGTCYVDKEKTFLDYKADKNWAVINNWGEYTSIF
jgi:hypothetical protein